MMKLLISIITLALMWPTQLRTAHAIPDVSCQPHKSGFFCHPSDPESFVICVGGFVSIFHCSPGSHFDYELRQCVAPSEARCLVKLVSSAPINATTKAPPGEMASRNVATNAGNETQAPVTTAQSRTISQTEAGNTTQEQAGGDVTPSRRNVTGETRRKDSTAVFTTTLSPAPNTSTPTGMAFNVTSPPPEHDTYAESSAATTLPAVNVTKVQETVTTPFVNTTLALSSSMQVPNNNFSTTLSTDEATAISTVAPVSTDDPKIGLGTGESTLLSTTGNITVTMTIQKPSDHTPTAAADTITHAMETGQENVSVTATSSFKKVVTHNETEPVTTEPTTSANGTRNRSSENITLTPRFTKTSGLVQTTAHPLAATTSKTITGQSSSAATFLSQESTIGVTEPTKPTRTQQQDVLEAICSSTSCQPPNCQCVSTQPPAQLAPADAPQMIILTVSGNIDRDTSDALESLFASLQNPNFCPPKATFFVVGQWDDRKSLSDIVKAQHELGLHSATHRLTSLWWATAGYFNYHLEVKQWRDILAEISGVPKGNITGWRSPFVQLGSDPMFKVLKDTGLQYDSTMIAGSTNFNDDALPLWPFTLDEPLSSYVHQKVCTNEPCPHGVYPGLWEVPLNRLYSPDGTQAFTLLDEFFDVHNSSAVQEMLEFNFQRHYTRGRAPFHVPMGEWVTRDKEARDGIRNFLQNALTSDDVWVVTTQQALAWMKQPLSTTLFKC